MKPPPLLILCCPEQFQIRRRQLSHLTNEMNAFFESIGYLCLIRGCLENALKCTVVHKHTQCQEYNLDVAQDGPAFEVLQV